MQMVQDIEFSNIPHFAEMGEAQILSATFDLSFKGKKFAEVTLPEVDLTGAKDGIKWANQTVGVLRSALRVCACALPA